MISWMHIQRGWVALTLVVHLHILEDPGDEVRPREDGGYFGEEAFDGADGDANVLLLHPLDDPLHLPVHDVVGGVVTVGRRSRGLGCHLGGRRVILIQEVAGRHGGGRGGGRDFRRWSYRHCGRRRRRHACDSTSCGHVRRCSCDSGRSCRHRFDIISAGPHLVSGDPSTRRTRMLGVSPHPQKD